MKKSPYEKDLFDGFRSSKFSAEGFMGNDARTVEEIISADRLELQKLETDNAAIALSFEKIFEKAESAMGAEVEIRPGVTARYFESRGKIPSPFRGEGTFEKGEVIVSYDKGSRHFFLSKLSIHLIKRHSFFQGQGARYRVDPGEAAKVIK